MMSTFPRHGAPAHLSPSAQGDDLASTVNPRGWVGRLDAAGNRLQEQDPTGVISYYTWNAAGQMTVADGPGGVINFVYNAQRQRVRKVLPGGYGRSGQMPYDPPYDPVSVPDPFSVPYHQFDAQWSTNANLDDANNVVSRFKYHAFGMPASSSNYGWADKWLMTLFLRPLFLRPNGL